MAHISETIQRRFSCRSFADTPVEAPILQTFRETVHAPQRGPFGNAPRFVLLSMENLSAEEWKRLGTYGVIKNARLFLAGMISPAPMANQDYGYCKEKLILKATELGLGSCWLGGTFAISAFGQAAGMKRNELLPTVAPIGYAAQHKSFRERLMRGLAGSDRRLPWEDIFFSDTRKSLTPEEAGPYLKALENVRLAPSASNKQPWRVVFDRGKKLFLFYMARAAGYRYLRNVSLQEIDMGIAMCHFELTIREAGLTGSWRIDDSAPPVKSWEYSASWQI